MGASKMAVEMKILSSHSDWLEARRNYIGGSDAAAVLGMNPYKSNVQLWQEKTGQLTPEDISDKPYVQYGTQAEMHLRGLFRLDFPEYEVHYVENNLWLNDKYPFAHASLDGWLTEKETGRKGILEIKTTNILQSQQKEKWNDRIPDNYYIQTLWYMAVTEFEFVILKANLKTVFNGVPYIQTKHYRIERADVESDIEYLMQKGSEFWEYVKAVKKPPLALPQI
jgi:putative phage-type endonuclease